MSERTYSVYLVERAGSQGGERQVTSPVRGTALDFYDSGVWLTREAGRNFFPYDQIRTIRERTDGESEAGAADEEGASEGTGDVGDAAGDPSEREEGAEEDLLE